MTLDEARAYLRSRPMDLKAKEVLELLERMEGALSQSFNYVRSSNKAERMIDGFGPRSSQKTDHLVHEIVSILAPFTHSRLE
jgi:hypothetical protein